MALQLDNTVGSPLEDARGKEHLNLVEVGAVLGTEFVLFIYLLFKDSSVLFPVFHLLMEGIKFNG